MPNCLYFVLVILLASVEARNKSPLNDEDNSRIRNRNAECVFGKDVKELGTQWTPDLGVPIGVLYCMRCECVALQRKRRIVARVQCRNIKNECPEVTCDDPVLKPGSCCKICPDAQNANIAQEQCLDVVSLNSNEDEEKNNKHYYFALLTGRSSLVTNNEPMSNEINKINVVANARFTFHKKNLHYSFFVSEKSARPQQLQFVDTNGNILEEFALSRRGGFVNSAYQNATKKVCGVWKRLPRDYRKLLRQGKMYAVLVWGDKDQSEVTLSGNILPQVGLAKETFSSLLEPSGKNKEAMMGSGGTAIVSYISTQSVNSIYVAVAFNGLFYNEETNEVPVKITLSYEEKKHVIAEEIITVDKASSELNIVETTISSVTHPDLRLLSRGRLLLTVSSVSHPNDLRLSGHIQTKIACELFQTTLSSGLNEPNKNGSSGLAWMYLDNEGSLLYSIQLDNFKSVPPFSITLMDIASKRKTEIDNLTPSFHGGWANGTLDKLSTKVLTPLHLGNLHINVATQSSNSLLKGRLVSKSVDDARDSAAPFLLRRENYDGIPASATGLAWVSIDSDCHLHYDVTLSGLEKMSERKFNLTLEMFPMLAPGAPVLAKNLGNFTGNQHEGSPIEALSNEETVRLFSGVCILKIKDYKSDQTLLTTTLKQIYVPPQCRPLYTDNNVPLSPYGEQTIMASQPGTCFYEGKFYDEEKQWTSLKNSCVTCFCQNGLAKCDTMTCPDLKCPSGEKIKVEGECCPVCSEYVENTNKCSLNGISYSAGAKFNPFLIPNGFDRCTECTCDPATLNIKCQRLSEKSCSNANQEEAEQQNDDLPAKRQEKFERRDMEEAKKILENGGCRNVNRPDKPYTNNSEFHPFIDTLGYYKCVTCKCQDGRQECRRKTCDLKTCALWRNKKRRNEPMDDNEFCCSAQECRKLRHKKNRHV
ncbi:unnamed protein product [Brassicogethes aeneus]|uniref:Dorsal-ventral patterning protein Sog n=1 Tax=Brassicogethes aeneus TaxID=1431903 RepID=A0A9P0B3H0_BRAAE|nr:unnamed protein product [Brassicogethes aeneus]